MSTEEFDDLDSVDGVESASDADGDASTIDAELLTALLDDHQALQVVHESAMDPGLIADPEASDAFRDILIFRARHNRPMTRKIFQERWKELELLDEYREIEYIIYDIRKFAKQRMIAKNVFAQYRLLEDNPDREENLEEVTELWRDGLSAYGKLFVPTTDRVRLFDPKSAMDRYMAKVQGNSPGIIIPFSEMAEDINSMEWGHVTGIFARPGAKKTFLLAFWLARVVIEQNYNVMLYSSEMGQEELEERIVGMMAKINYDLLSKGKLKEDEYEKMETFLRDEVAGLLQKHMYIAGPTSVRTMADLEIYCNENQVHAVGIDNAHTIVAKGTEMHNQIHNLMLDMKQMAMRQQLHVIYTTHQNRYSGKGMGGVAYGDAFNTWSSNMININPHKGSVIEVSTPKVRNGRGGMTYKILFDLYEGKIRSIGKYETDDDDDDSDDSDFGEI